MGITMKACITSIVEQEVCIRSWTTRYIYSRNDRPESPMPARPEATDTNSRIMKATNTCLNRLTLCRRVVFTG